MIQCLPVISELIFHRPTLTMAAHVIKPPESEYIPPPQQQQHLPPSHSSLVECADSIATCLCNVYTLTGLREYRYIPALVPESPLGLHPRELSRPHVGISMYSPSLDKVQIRVNPIGPPPCSCAVCPLLAAGARPLPWASCNYSRSCTHLEYQTRPSSSCHAQCVFVYC